MSVSSASMIVSVPVIAGLALYTSSFFLAAVNSGGSIMSGWECASFVTASLWSSTLDLGSFEMRIIGLINPMIAVYLILRFTRLCPGAHPYLAASILAGMGLTGFLLGRAGFDLRIGHAMWVSGMLMILAPELAGWRFTLKRRAASEIVLQPNPAMPAHGRPQPELPPLLCVVAGPHAGHKVPVTAAEFWIGSQSNNHLRLDADGKVSGNHACIRKQADGLYLYDHASRNDTWVNGEAIGTRVVMLRPGDSLKVGASVITLQPAVLP